MSGTCVRSVMVQETCGGHRVGSQGRDVCGTCGFGLGVPSAHSKGHLLGAQLSIFDGQATGLKVTRVLGPVLH